jgi:DnaJ family protein C protein 22
LNLSQTASQSEVTSKWRALSREHHPDKVKGSEEERRKAQEKFLEIQQAYEILSSAKYRRQKKNKKSDIEL